MIARALATLVAILSTSPAMALPVKTVPWNGHPGAVSFTFDDGCLSQVRNVLPSLARRNIHATFFLIGDTYAANASKWIAAARAGNELANHTMTHTDLTTLDSAQIDQEISGMAAILRSLDTSIQAVTLAYPFCATNELVDRIADKEDIVARTCGGYARFKWSDAPAQWMSLTSFVVSDTATAHEALTEIDRAAANRTWMVTLDHGVGGDWLAITANQADSMFDRAIQRNLWIGTYQEVAAYWKASKTLDTAQAKSVGSGWTISWISPHGRMPRQVPVRVKLDSSVFGKTFSVSQGGIDLAPEADGSYVIDFMRLALEVKPVTSRIRSSSLRHRMRAERDGEAWNLSGLLPGGYGYAFRSPSGRLLGSGRILVSETGDGKISHAPRCATVLRLVSNDGRIEQAIATHPGI